MPQFLAAELDPIRYVGQLVIDGNKERTERTRHVVERLRAFQAQQRAG